MAEVSKDPLSPASKDPVEGARGPAQGGDPDGDISVSRLGLGGDPAEGRRDDDTGEFRPPA